MTEIERHTWRDDRLAGVVHCASGLALGVGVGAGLTKICGVPAATASAGTIAVGGRMLGELAGSIGVALENNDLELARSLLPGLVGRSTLGLSPSEIARAVIESVAENTVDAVVAPALWAGLVGAPGAFGYRAVNTLDAMVGHRNPRYVRFGWASARLDDVANYVPARFTALMVAFVRPRSAKSVWLVVRRDASAHPSPNSGVAEAAFAAALGVQLGGSNHYAYGAEDRGLLGDGRAPTGEDISAAVRLSRDVSLACTGFLLIVAWLSWARRRRSQRNERTGRREVAL